MKYTIKNIKAFLKNEKMIFTLVLLCVVTSSFVISFSYGLYRNYKMVKEDEENGMYEFTVPFRNTKKAHATKEELRNAVLTFSDELNEAVDMYYVEPKAGKKGKDRMVNGIITRFCIKDKTIIPCELFKNNLIKYDLLESGRYFSEEEEKNGEYVALIFDDSKYSNHQIVDLMIDENTIVIQEHEYKVVGYEKVYPLIVPFESLDDATRIGKMLFHFKKPVRRSQYNEIKEVMELNFPDIAKVPELDIAENENAYLYNTIILISALIALLIH